MCSTFKAPKPLTVDLVYDAASSCPGKHNGSLRRCSPEEEHHSFILATDRDLACDLNVDGWVKAWKGSIAKIILMENEEQIFWHAGSLREEIGERFDCLYYSTVPKKHHHHGFSFFYG